MTATRDLIMACANGEFLGYGNPSAPVWLVGIEEHGAEVRSGAVTLEESLTARANFGVATDLGDTWDRHFRYPPSRMKTGTWWWGSRLVLATEGNEDPSKDEIRAYRAERLGTKRGTSFLPDLYPLPMNKRDYGDWYANAPWPSYRAYCAAVGPPRARRILDLAAKGDTPRVLVAYAKRVGEVLRDAWPGDVEQLDGVAAGSDSSWWALRHGAREVRLAITPFWGQGQYSTAKLMLLAKAIRAFRDGRE